MTKTENKRKNKVLSIILILFVVSGLILLSYAWYQERGVARGTLKFSGGIEAIITNLSEKNEVLQKTANLNIYISHLNGTILDNGKQILDKENQNFATLSKNDILTVLNPTIAPAEGTSAYFLRAKWDIFVDDGGEGVSPILIEEENWPTMANINTMPQFNNNFWVKGSDGWYYCVISSDTPELNGAKDLYENFNDGVDSSETITFFDDSNNKIITAGEDTFRKEIENLVIELKIEVIQNNIENTNIQWQPYKSVEEFSPIIDDESGEITGLNFNSYVGNQENYTIPTAVVYQGQEYPVTHILANSFSGNIFVKNITLPSSIITIEEGAFENVINLKTINLTSALSSAVNLPQISQKVWKVGDTEVTTLQEIGVYTLEDIEIEDIEVDYSYEVSENDKLL